MRIKATESLGTMHESSLMRLSEKGYMGLMDLLYKISDKKQFGVRARIYCM